MQIPFASDLLRAQFTQLWMIAGDQIWINVFLVFTFPRFECVQLRQRCRSSNPLDRLVVGHKVDVFVLKQIVNEPLEDSEVLLFLEPESKEK